MTIKEIAVCAFKMLGRSDIAQTLLSGGTPDGEEAEKTDTLLYCINAVEDELARYYFPVKLTETLSSADGKYYFSAFTNRPVKILSVMADGKNAEYTASAQYILCAEKKITVEYEYAPAKKQLDDKSAFNGTAVGEKLVASGAAAEYCLVAGSIQLAQLWESRYREEIDLARGKFRTHAYIPPRRWV